MDIPCAAQISMKPGMSILTLACVGLFLEVPKNFGILVVIVIMTKLMIIPGIPNHMRIELRGESWAGCRGPGPSHPNSINYKI